MWTEKGRAAMESDAILLLRDEIVRLCAPQKIYVFSQKNSMEGQLCAVKLCVIIAEGDSHRVEHGLYVELDSDVPFDVLVYTQDEWQHLLKNNMSFASRIQKSGRLLYAAD